ncbi:VCBS domain-containing protein, partial [Marinobacterium sediminicola]
MSTPNNKPGAVLPNLMQLEQRLMFDGAAVEASIDTLADHVADQQAVETADDMFSLAVAHGQTQQAADQAQQQIKNYFERASAEELFQLFNGGKDTLDAQWLQSMEALRQSILSGEYQIRVELLDSDTIKGALGAFAAEGTDGEPTIYLNREWVEGIAGERDIVKVLVEELGHSIDSLVNAGGDTAGDEGEAFAAAVAGTEQNGVISTDASATLDIDGETVEVEFATYDFQTAYAIVVDIENNAEAQDWIPDENFEYAIDKESNTHNFIYTANGLGSVTVIDDTDSRYFSGNDVSAIGINIGGETYYGWISRPIKVQGEVKGFYFWTDTDFVDFSTAQADGNQDGDSSTVDNRGFILAVDKAYFDGLGFVSRSGVASDTYKVIGSSSDRVDNALNALIDSNTAPVAQDVTSGTSSGTTAAIEQGYGVAGQNAGGNVLDFASDADNDTLSVIAVGPGNGAVQTAVGETPVVLNGQYGTLTLNADGTYTYVLNNTLPQVDALNVGDQLSDQFTFTISDGKGETDSAILTIRIDGTNDEPTANPDYNQAKESTTLIGSGFDYTGYGASGNVLGNDADVDDQGAELSIQGVQVSGSLSSDNVTVESGTLSLQFSSGSGFAAVKIGDYLYVSVDGTAAGSGDGTGNYVALYAADDSAITITVKGTDALGNDVLEFSAVPAAYYGASGNIAINDVEAFFQANAWVAGNSNLMTTTQDGGQTKVAQLAVASTTGSTTLSNVSSLDGTIAVGMSVTGAGVPAGTRVESLEYTNGILTGVVLDAELTDTTGGEFTFTGDAGVTQTLQGAHGELVLQADGTYTYTPFTDNPLLAEGESAVEVFDYTMRDSAGVESTSTLYITVYGTGSNDPYLGHDNGTAVESGIDAGGSTIGSDATGNVLNNDQDIFNGATPGLNKVTQVAVQGSGASTISSGSSAVISGEYGSLTLASDGTYTYAVNDSLAVVDALAPGESLTEVFTYQVTNGFSKTSWATLTITISGSNDAPVAVADTNTIRENAVVPVTGSVLSNDSDVDNGDSLSVTGIGTTSADTAVTGGTTGVDGTDVTGTYGTLTIGADGSYSYAVTAEIAAGMDVDDVFTYEVRDTNGGITTKTLTITVSGGNEPPINAYPTVVTTTGTDPIVFTGGTEISVADQDGNLSWVVLKVDNGVLSVTPGSASVDGEVTSELRITGTQSEINAALATLIYQADTAFAGTDYLTIMSQDSDFANDSDSVEIVVEETLAVNGYGPVNEGSQYAMFEVTGYNGQTVELAIENDTATLTSPTIQYSTDGSDWANYGVGSEPVMPANGTLYVRVDISSEHDTVYEGTENFKLIATDKNVDGLTAEAVTAIIDDGSG